MKEQITTAQIKSAARDALLGNLNVALAASVVYMLIYAAVVRLLSFSGGGGFSLLWMQVSSIAVSLLTGVFLSGFAYLNINMIFGNRPQLGHLFHGFREEPNKAILIQLAFVLRSLLCNIPLFLYNAIAGARVNVIMELFFMLLVPVLTFFATLPISQSFFLLQDFPERSAGELLAASTRLMEGNKERLVRLTVSFAPLFLLCVLTLFIPLFWLQSYYRASMAVFYKDLVGRDHGDR